MYALRPKVDAATAGRKLRSRWDWFRARTGFRPPVAGKRLPHLEQIWLPHYLVTFKALSGKKPGKINVSVDAYSGGFTVFHGTPDFHPLSADHEIYPPKLSVDEAVPLARRGMQKYVILARGQRNKPVISDALEIQSFQYPFWVYYFERRRGLLDIRVLDGITAERPGHKLKMAVLDAFSAGEK